MLTRIPSSHYCTQYMKAENGFRSKVVGSLLAVNHGGDSDSTGSIAAQILGAMLCVEAIPPEWLHGLGLRSVVERVAGDLHDVFHEDRVFPTEEYPTW